MKVAKKLPDVKGSATPISQVAESALADAPEDESGPPRRAGESPALQGDSGGAGCFRNDRTPG